MSQWEVTEFSVAQNLTTRTLLVPVVINGIPPIVALNSHTIVAVRTLPHPKAGSHCLPLTGALILLLKVHLRLLVNVFLLVPYLDLLGQ